MTREERLKPICEALKELHKMICERRASPPFDKLPDMAETEVNEHVNSDIFIKEKELSEKCRELSSEDWYYAMNTIS